MRSIAACIVMLALAAFGARASEKALAPLWVGPAFSGSWYTPERSGEGFILQILDNGTALLLWFTYPPAGSNAQQAWIYADGGIIDGERIRFNTSHTTRGGRFGVTSGGVQVQRIPWGSIELRFTNCNTGEVTYTGPAAWGSGTRTITRLTEISELGCGGKRLLAGGTRAIEGLRQRSGAWYNAASDADGWAVEELPNGRALVYWFTHDAGGEQAWTYGEAAASGARLAVTNYRPVGTRFGAAFDPARIMQTSWGSLEMVFDGCDRATLTYTSTDTAFGSGTLQPARLSRLSGAACHGEKPTVNAAGTWSTGPTMPSRQSEVATATIGTRTCAAGGFPARNDFQCFDAATNAWTTLAPLPAGRDHGEAVAFEGDYYFTGGNGEDGGSWGWRYRFATNAWEAIPQLPLVSASAAAVLGSYAYFGGSSGAVIQYNLRTHQFRVIPGDGRVLRDHSQLVAFQGELWLLGGRNGQGVANNAVSIFDPASETWRVGPSLPARRSGFAAAASATTLFVGGGEVLEPPFQVLASAEAIAAGDAGWTPIPSMPIPIHGVGSAIHGNAFYVIGGSRAAATATNFGDLQIYRFGP